MFSIYIIIDFLDTIEKVSVESEEAGESGKAEYEVGWGFKYSSQII